MKTRKTAIPKLTVRFQCPICHATVRTTVNITGATCDGGGKHRQTAMQKVSRTA